MDEIDQSILIELQKNARISMTDLGRKIGLSTPATNERVKKLEDKEVIKGYRAIIDPEKLNKNVTAFILFDTKQGKKFKDFCKEQPMVVECHRLAGQFSYLVKVVTESVKILEEFIDATLSFGEPTTLMNLSSVVDYKPFIKDDVVEEGHRKS
ncbi:Lrp/AsnC family transcriptional regulator [Gracilibacillus sp. S3-1-1]|uniref:Lrp/AsnC family transcriptional regulator n=1 Tax=Gracilibacillus pellucidus TaxID=3095368 RepID=A0ACC6M2A4_9BACI|nr:Lrp/AsnC family transcriptional regulator [Gracilibacillus sp. S3-1-1]MDX8044987.1 Lrp/AsnC family transcriptional regulator [Gracilibacillus sp. S3-1-1]